MTKSSLKASRKPSVIVLGQLFDLSYDYDAQGDALYNAMVKAGKDQKDVRDNVVHGRVARRLFPKIPRETAKARTLAIYAQKRADRGELFLKADGAARVWICGFMKQFEIKTTSARGGKREPKVTKVASKDVAIADKANQVATPGTMTAPAPRSLTPPKFSDAVSMRAYIETAAATLMALINANAGIKDCTEEKAAIVAFHAAIKAAKH